MTITLSIQQLLKFQTRVVGEKIQSNNKQKIHESDLINVKDVSFK
jgi:hypothetical protein